MKLAPSIAALGVVTSTSWLAGAQAPEVPPTGEVREPTVIVRRDMTAPRDALELSLATGYTQGFGSLTRGVGLPSIATAGVGLDFGVGYRINAHWAVLWTGEYQELTAERSDSVGGITNTVGVQYHVAPTHRTDPWVELGAGYRFLWESYAYGPTVQWHGFQLAHLRVGLDFRTDEDIALGPVIGADATMFRWQDLPYYSAYISDARLSTFIYVGVQGRIDFGGHTKSEYEVYSRR